MKTGIIVCGCNGAGKSTLGRALAQRPGFFFLDAEDIWFDKADPSNAYAAQRTHEQASALLAREISAHSSFVFAYVTGAYGNALRDSAKVIVRMHAPAALRMRRVKARSFERFGARMQPGGDLFDQEERFFRMVASKAESRIDDWLQTTRCPVVDIDGTKSVEDNLAFLLPHPLIGGKERSDHAE